MIDNTSLDHPKLVYVGTNPYCDLPFDHCFSFAILTHFIHVVSIRASSSVVLPANRTSFIVGVSWIQFHHYRIDYRFSEYSSEPRGKCVTDMTITFQVALLE